MVSPTSDETLETDTRARVGEFTTPLASTIQGPIQILPRISRIGLLPTEDVL